MKHNIASYLKAVVALTLAFTIAPLCQALTAGHFATSSRLAQGKWVKIAVPASGVYEITAEQLREMGFSSPEAVHIFGCGGAPISEVLDGRYPDDLQQVPTQVIGGKLFFYARGTVALGHTGSGNSLRYTRTRNAYSDTAYYFLTQSAGTNLSPVQVSTTEMGTNARSQSLACDLHEQELCSPSQTGKDLLGERIEASGLNVPLHLPGIVAGTKVTINPRVIANAADSSFLSATLSMGGSQQPINFVRREAAIRPVRDSQGDYLSYYYCSPAASVVPEQSAGETSVTLKLSCASYILKSNLDWVITTYTRHNALAPGEAQMNLGVTALTTTDRIELADSSLVVWNIDAPDAPVQHLLSPCDVTDSTGVTTRTWAFSPGVQKSFAQYVAFNPQATLPHIASWQAVANQNIHADSLPDMVIITRQEFLDQAKRIAHMHAQKDRMRVNIYDQQQIFNEFSSGTPDAMAFRLMNKMFYDRDNAQNRRFRYVLILGCGSYDNRGHVSAKPYRVLTFESDASNDETISYACDDFFGMMDDNSGRNLSSDKLRLGIGRIPSADPAECKSDVDKLLKYVLTPDYGVWRNNVLVTADQGDGGMHQFQAEGISEIIEKDQGAKMVINRGFNGMFPVSSTLVEKNVPLQERTAAGARSYWIDQLKAGQYFMTYVGHAGPTDFTKRNHLWTRQQVRSTNYVHFPIVTTAACDVARYDCDDRGIAELMFHKPDGGAIALLSSARTVFANSNDRLNRAFVTGLFTPSTTGQPVRLGDAYVKCKQAFGNASDNSKMSFWLIGDPALRFEYPQPRFQITKIDGKNVANGTAVATQPLNKLTIEARVLDERDSTLTDAGFSGRATISLYDFLTNFASLSGNLNGSRVTRVVPNPRNLLVQVTDTVIHGVLKTEIVVPRNVMSIGYKGLLSVYAHNKYTNAMVSGQYNQLVLAHYNGKTANPDTQAPVITSMFLGDENAMTDGQPLPMGSILHVTATDDQAISTQQQAVNQGLTLTLDDGAFSYPEVNHYAQVSDGGRSLTLAMPVEHLSPGQHKLTLTVADATGNTTSRTIHFLVGEPSRVDLFTEQVAAENSITFNIATTNELPSTPTVHIHVTDAAGRQVWHKKTSEFPLTWNLRGTRGRRLEPGVYHFWGTYQTGTVTGGTQVGQLVVIK